uniref:Uncharacterized protein n=1 Tax=Aegilops tauschii TaxID=37682 RepID=N1QW85_AEGTA
MGGRADAGADTMAHEASKPRAKLHKEKPVPAGEGSSRQQGSLDIVDHVQGLHPVQVAPMTEQVLSDDVDSDPETQRIYRRQKDPN